MEVNTPKYHMTAKCIDGFLNYVVTVMDQKTLESVQIRCNVRLGSEHGVVFKQATNAIKRWGFKDQ